MAEERTLAKGGCLSCWRRAAAQTHIYTRRGHYNWDEPWQTRTITWENVSTVQLYRERHAQHLARIAAGEPWVD